MSPAGGVSRRRLRFDSPALRDLEWPCFEATGARDGPRLCILAGIHGCEYSSIAAAVRVMRGLDPSALAGSVVAVPIVNLPAFRTRTPFVSPGDGKNLNRCFPGDPDGTFSDQLAHHVHTELIAPADALVDLHGGDLVEALEPFTLYDASPVDETARAMAIAFGLPYVVCTEREGAAIAGTTSAAAADAGVAGITPEVGGCGLLEEDAIAAHVRGVENVMRSLGMLEGDVEPPPAATAIGRPGSCGCAAARPAGGSRRCGSARRSRPAGAWAPCSTRSATSARSIDGPRGRRAALHHVEPGRGRRRPAARPGRRHHAALDAPNGVRPLLVRPSRARRPHGK